jgi:hypothetical protein
MLGAVPPELHYKYRAQVWMGQAIYADVHSNTLGRALPSTFLTPDERALAMEWVVYHALKNTDKYVWFYTELTHYLKNLRVAPQMIPAIERARRKVARNEAIGFDYEPLEKRASEGYNKALYGEVTPSKAKVMRINAPPTIDGKLDEAVWEKSSRLGPFQKVRMATNPIDTTTSARMAYDDANLYIAFHCDDPDKIKLEASKIDQDNEQRGNGHYIEVGIAADADVSKYYHIKFTWDNRRWDSLTPASVWPDEISGKNSSWDAKYEAAIYIAADHSVWSVEMAIPWATLGRPAPTAGEQIKGNLILRTDRRPSHGNYEFSSWSQMRRARLIEAKTLGTWEFN